MDKKIEKKSITYIVPYYKVSYEVLIRCFRSVERILSADDEVIIIDDGSNIKDQIKKYCEKNNRLRFYANKGNLGVSKSRNRGIELARTEWVTFVDSDDRIIADDVLELKNKLSEECDVLACEVRSKVGRRKYDYSLYNRETPEELRKEVLRQKSNDKKKKTHIGIAVGKIYSVDFLRKHNIVFDPKLSRAEDNVFFLEVLKYRPRIESSKTCFYEIISNKSSTTHRYTEGLYDIFNATLKELRARSSSKEEDELINLRQGKYSLCAIENELRAIKTKNWQEIKSNINYIIDNDSDYIANYAHNSESRYVKIISRLLFGGHILCVEIVYKIKCACKKMVGRI